MGLFDWILRKTAKDNTQKVEPAITLRMRVETVRTQEPCREFSGIIESNPVRAEVPIESKAKCERLLLKTNRSFDDKEFLNSNYWVRVYYKGERYGYHGISDIWTYSARDLPELPLLHDWVYSILGKAKADIPGLVTLKTWEERGSMHALGAHNSVKVEVSFKPRGYVLSFLLSDDLRWEDKASYNTKTERADFPFYYSSAQANIIDWAKEIFTQSRAPEKKA